jgi:hypothetical protein
MGSIKNYLNSEGFLSIYSKPQFGLMTQLANLMWHWPGTVFPVRYRLRLAKRLPLRGNRCKLLLAFGVYCTAFGLQGRPR